MGCQKCRGWEDSECCLSQSSACACACHTSCDCAFCYTVELKARSTGGICSGHAAPSRSTASRITTALRLEPRASLTYDSTPDSRPPAMPRVSTDERKSTKARKWSRRGSMLKPLRLFA
ncbi:hypothetical protein H4R23_004954 [Coemansia sp. Cherry 401B]|nr:hypothetical protein IWW52_006058 [Coemansia sp. RSA 2704]KAJ2718827.1 hypothetical protein H4R23_004954 [Coemansia sp. Cherry 401B]